MTRPCANMGILMHGYFDGELDAANALHFEEHMKDCQGCAREYRRLTQLREALRQDGIQYKAPDALRARLMAAISRERSAIDPWWKQWSRSWRLGTAGFAIAASLGAFLLLLPRSPGLEQELVSGHVRSLMANHLTDVTTSDQHTVKPWFNGRLDYAPPVIDLADQGFALSGGRLDYIGGRSVAALVYKRRGHVINVFLWPEAQSTASQIAQGAMQGSTRDGYNMQHWTRDGMSFWAVSDLNETELREFERLFLARIGTDRPIQ
ncbi:anti-sigma factor family protein [Microvirga sp. 2TAF3]|uniref:anti-sigma factor family protein n=1 Tax=Microvirga sp. 2TAF3 TaxID=3233014 RepID=UPI003F9DE335